MVTRLQPQWLPAVWTQLPFPRFLDDDEGSDAAGHWSFAIVALERDGRVALPPSARAVVAACASPRALTRGEFVLRPGDAGRPVRIDGRGLLVPCWLRDAAGPAASLSVGTRREPDDEPVVLLAPPRLLAGFADALVGNHIHSLASPR
jgi:hypothetical protein